MRTGDWRWATGDPLEAKRNTRITGVRTLMLALLTIAIGACAQAPITGRQQLNLVPRDELFATSFQQYEQFLNENTVVHGTPESRMVQAVGRDIQNAVEEYFRRRGQSDRLQGYRWEFHLIRDSSANAWAMPGGKVAIYTGLLSITKDRAGLAVVMGHEVAHAVARHGNERMSQQLLTRMGGTALSVALSQQPQATRELWMQAFGAGAKYGVLLPYSRVQETEADRLGLIFMALAGYDPAVAVDLWQRMAKQGGPGPPEFLSTHPSDESRIENLKDFVPEARTYLPSES